MKKRKVLAVVLSAAMVVGSSMTAFAASGNASGDVTVNGEGDVSYVDTMVYNVLLPTSNAMSDKLVVDPQGISKLENGQVATAEELASGAGIITCVNTPIVKNLSSVPMKVSVLMSVSGDATPVDAVEDVESGDATNVLLYAVPSATDATSGDLYRPSTKGIVLNESGVTAEFILEAGAYNFSKDNSGTVTYVPVSGDVGHGTGLQFGGYVNKKADWSDYVKASSPSKIGMTAKFSFTSEIADGEVADPSGDAYAMMAYSGTTVDVVPTDAAPSVADVTRTQGDTTDCVITCNLGAGESGASRITDVVVTYNGSTFSKNGIWNITTELASQIEIAGNKVTLNGDWVSYFPAGTYPICIVYDGDESKTSMIDLVIE